MKITKKVNRNKQNTYSSLTDYNYYLALDWSQVNYALGVLTPKSKHPRYLRGPAKIDNIQNHLSGLRGKKILTIEETTSTHWLYAELYECVDKIVICDPYRNSLLSDGAKNDDIDAGKLSLLLRGGFLKEVYHTLDNSYQIRKLLSGYEDLIKMGVRLQNQKSALYRAEGLNSKKDSGLPADTFMSFVEEQQNSLITHYEETKQKYLEQFRQLRKNIPIINKMCRISGINTISAVKIYGTVLDAKRFSGKNKYWGYCGLVHHQKTSGGRNYGKRKIRHSRRLKSVYKTAALAAISGKNDIGEYYQELLSQGYSEYKARHAVARYIATSTYAMMKNATEYIPYSWRKKE